MYWPDMNPVLTQTKTVSAGTSDVRKRLAFAYVDRACSPEFQEAMGRDIYMRPTNMNASVFEGMEALGVTNEAESAESLFIPDWNWYLDNEQDIVEQVNEIFGQ
jgi:putative spermidine/putrescine transport system substrate-binding protein